MASGFAAVAAGLVLSLRVHHQALYQVLLQDLALPLYRVGFHRLDYHFLGFHHFPVSLHLDYLLDYCLGLSPEYFLEYHPVCRQVTVYLVYLFDTP
jgi:hypothetical protein